MIISAIVAQWCSQATVSDFGGKILVTAPSNTAANNLAEKLSKLPMLKGMARYFPTKRQDLFNLKKDSIYPYSLLQVIINNLDSIELSSKRMFSNEKESDDDVSFDQGDEEN